MKISEEYRELMDYLNLPERFRAGDFFLYEEEKAVLEDFIDCFCESVSQNGCVPLDDFFEFMDFLDLIKDGDSNEVMLLTTHAFIKCRELRIAVEKQKQGGE